MAFENDDNFDKESYVGVNERLTEFYKKHPEGRVETSVTVVGDGIIVKASLYRKAEDTLPAATGHSFLTDMAGDKVGEYTETVAVGRGLALMGFRVEKSIASSQEMNRFQENKEAKKETKERKPRGAKKDEFQQDLDRQAAAGLKTGGAPTEPVDEHASDIGAGTPASAPVEEPKLRANRFRLPQRQSQQANG